MVCCCILHLPSSIPTASPSWKHFQFLHSWTYPFGGKPPKARQPLLWTTDQPATDELKYSQDRAWRHPRTTKNLLEVWQNLAIGGRPIGGAVEALLTKVVINGWWPLGAVPFHLPSPVTVLLLLPQALIAFAASLIPTASSSWKRFQFPYSWIYPFGGKPPKALQPLLWMTDWPTAKESKYSRDRAWRHLCATKNLLEVWQNLAILGSRPIGGTIEVLLTKVVVYGRWHGWW